jgi:hypothetical protein
VLAAGVAALCVSGLLITFVGLHPWWSITEGLLGMFSLAFLALTHFTDPGVIPANSEEDPLIQELHGKASLEPLSLTVTIQLDGETYRLVRVENIWSHLTAGVQPFPHRAPGWTQVQAKWKSARPVARVDCIVWNKVLRAGMAVLYCT